MASIATSNILTAGSASLVKLKEDLYVMCMDSCRAFLKRERILLIP